MSTCVDTRSAPILLTASTVHTEAHIKLNILKHGTSIICYSIVHPVQLCSTLCRARNQDIISVVVLVGYPSFMYPQYVVVMYKLNYATFFSN